MADTTGIEWCDSTWNGWLGCTRVSPACDDCYAARSTPARTLGIAWGAGEPRRRTSDANWKLPKTWAAQPFAECMHCGWRGESRKASPQLNPAGFDKAPGVMLLCPVCQHPTLKEARRRVFSASLSDWLDNEVPIKWLADLLYQVMMTPRLDWLLLSKRIGNWRARVTAAAGAAAMADGRVRWPGLAEWLIDWLDGRPSRNVWAMATICNQEEADRDIIKLLRVPAVVRGLSVEPMLGPVDLTDVPVGGGHGHHEFDPIVTGNALHRAVSSDPHLHWVICGGESGLKARPMHPDWARSLRDQCAAAGVPFLLKQWGEWLGEKQDGAHDHEPLELNATDAPVRVGKRAAGRLLDGRTHDGFPGGAS